MSSTEKVKFSPYRPLAKPHHSAVSAAPYLIGGPLLQPGLFQGSAGKDDQLDAVLGARSVDGGEKFVHAIPLPTGIPIGMETAVETIQATFGVDDETEFPLYSILGASRSLRLTRELPQFTDVDGNDGIFTLVL